MGFKYIAIHFTKLCFNTDNANLVVVARTAKQKNK